MALAHFPSPDRLRKTQSGFAAIAAIFLVVVLAALGGFMLTFSNTQQLTSAQDLQGSRAYWAARAGLEFGIGSVTLNGVCPSSPTKLTVDSYTVCVTCVPASYTDAIALTIFQFKSDAYSIAPNSCSPADLTLLANSSVGKLGYVERSLSASMEKN
jgi:MSHA biogenesis protein MshP